MCQTNIGHFGHKFEGEGEHSVKDCRRVEGSNGSVQVEASAEVHKGLSEDVLPLSHCVLTLLFPGLRGEAGRVVPLPGPPGTQGLPGSPGFEGPQGTFRILLHLEKQLYQFFIFFTDHWSCSQQVTEVFLEPREGQASQERRVLSASLALDFQGPQAPKVNL